MFVLEEVEYIADTRCYQLKHTWHLFLYIVNTISLDAQYTKPVERELK